MTLPKSSPPTLRRERGEGPRMVLFVQVTQVSPPPWELKRQCVLCGCVDVTDPCGALCPDCLTFNPNSNL